MILLASASATKHAPKPGEKSIHNENICGEIYRVRQGRGPGVCPRGREGGAGGCVSSGCCSQWARPLPHSLRPASLHLPRACLRCACCACCSSLLRALRAFHDPFSLLAGHGGAALIFITISGSSRSSSGGSTLSCGALDAAASRGGTPGVGAGSLLHDLVCMDDPPPLTSDCSSPASEPIRP